MRAPTDNQTNESQNEARHPNSGEMNKEQNQTRNMRISVQIRKRKGKKEFNNYKNETRKSNINAEECVAMFYRLC